MRNVVRNCWVKSSFKTPDSQRNYGSGLPSRNGHGLKWRELAQKTPECRDGPPGDFFHPGQAYTDGRVLVQDHDFVTSQQRLVPYGVYDVRRNEGLLRLACGADTCELARDAIWSWWQRLGRQHYWYAPRLLLLCDCGGSNSNRQQRFKQELCELAADRRCDIRVAHYPPGCSKYNPIEHRLFCHVSRSLRAVVLKTIEVAKTFIARTTTATGLRVVAEIARRSYERGVKATPEFLDHNPIRFDRFLPQLNYTAPWINLL